MNDMESKEELVSKISRPLTRPLEIAQTAFMLAIFSSPFIYIWYDLGVAVKVGATGLIGAAILELVYKLIKWAASQAYDEEIKKD